MTHDNFELSKKQAVFVGCLLCLNIVESGKNYDEATLAVEALLNVVPGSEEKIVEIFHSTLKKEPQTARLRGKILSRLYEHTFQAEDVLSVCHDVLYDTDKHAIGELWGMAATLPETALPDILDTLTALDTGEEFQSKRTNQHIIEYFFEHLLNRLLQTKFTPEPQRLWQWLACLYFLGGRYYTGNHKEIASWLKQNKPFVFAMLLSAIAQVEKEKHWSFWSDFEQITMHSLAGEDLIRMVSRELEGKSNVSDADHFLYEICGYRVFHLEPESRLELFDKFQALAKQHPSLQPVCDVCCQCPIEDWRLRNIERRLKHKEKKENQKKQTQRNLEKTQEAIQTGEHLHNIGFLAKVYFGDLYEIDRTLPPHIRLSETIGEKYVNPALSGFAAVLERDDLPTPHEVALSLAQNKYWPWWHGVLAGINEAWLRQGKALKGFSGNLLKSALAIATELPIRSDGDKDREWLPQLLRERPDIVKPVYEEIVRTQLRHKKTHITVLSYLQHNDETKRWRSKVALKLLKQFPCCPPVSLEALMLAGFYEPEFRDTLIQQAQQGIVCCHGKQRQLWLVTAFLLKPDDYSEPLKAYSARHKDIVWLLRDMSQRAILQETGNSLQLSTNQLECCVLVAGRAFKNISRPNSVTIGDQNPCDATEWIRKNINKLAADPTSEATEALKRLLADNSLSSYHDHLRHNLANQTVARREAEYRQPSWAEAIEALKGGKPANIADLHALVVDQMQTIKHEIRHTNTAPYKAFWRCDSHARVHAPKVEDLCRDRLIDLLKPALLPLDLHLEPEGHMAADKRSDIMIHGPGGMRLPIELKRDFHEDLWTACEDQLEQMYAKDPGAAGYGIYGVFWFGDRRTSKMKTPPDEIAMPQSAKELENALQSLVPTDQQEKIRVAVFDVTPPFQE